MKIKCYVPGCKNRREIHWLGYLWMVVRALSFAPFVCPDHYDLFDF